MVSSVAVSVMHNVEEARPLKRPRKSAVASSPPDSEDTKYVHNVPVDHIFIAEGNVMKKAGGKKVCQFLDTFSGPLIQQPSQAPLSCCECRRYADLLAPS